MSVGQTHWDHIIIGGGTAGCLMANRLSADKSRRVLLVEAGGRDDYHWIHIPVGYLYCIGNPRTDWLYSTEADPGLNGRSLRYPRGKVLGGCSSINGMIYMRGQSRDYDGWAERVGDARWRWDFCVPYFKRHEDHWRGPDLMHGAPGFDRSGRRQGGEWRVERQRLSWEVLDAFAAAAQQAGIPATQDFNTGNNEGVGYFEVNQRRGVRWNASKGFLGPVKKRPNLEVRTGWQTTRLLLSEGTTAPLEVQGVELVPTAGGAPVQLHARRGVILCAGAIGTPQILQLSGIGPVRSTPWPPQPGARRRSAWNTLRRSGPMSMSPSQLGAFTRSSPQHSWPNVEYHVQPLSLDAFGEPLHAFDAFTASVCNLNPTSRGHVRIRSPRPQDAPLILAHYLSTPADRRVAADSLRLTRRIVSMPAMARLRPQEIKPGTAFQSDDDLARLAGDIGTTIFHPVGTCRMGRADDPATVVDSRLRVLGVGRLRIVDASVMPTITSGNTNSPTLMIAERAAEWVLAES